MARKRHSDHDETLIYRARVHWWFNLRSYGLRNLLDRVLITDRRIIERTGILAVQTRSLTLDQIETRDVVQSVWGRIFGFGDIVLHGAGGQPLQLLDLRDPDGVARAIDRAAADSRRHGAGTPAARPLRQAGRTSA